MSTDEATCLDWDKSLEGMSHFSRSAFRQIAGPYPSIHQELRGSGKKRNSAVNYGKVGGTAWVFTYLVQRSGIGQGWPAYHQRTARE